MIKANITLDGNKRIVLFGITDNNLKLLGEDKPIAFPAARILVHGVQTVVITAVRDVGHFLQTVATGLGLSDMVQQQFIDTYRKHIRTGQVRNWFPWVQGHGAILDDQAGMVACGFLVSEAEAALREGGTLRVSGSVLGMRAWDEVILFHGATGIELRERLLREVLPIYNASKRVIDEVDSYLGELDLANS